MSAKSLLLPGAEQQGRFDCESQNTKLTNLLSMEDLLDRIGGRDLIGWHRQQPSLSANVYLDHYRRVLLSGLRDTQVIYLDTNYWVRLRRAELGQGSLDEARLLKALRTSVRAREVLCVSQLHSLMELAKQDEASLRVTASLLDELTEGVAISSPDDIVAWECAEFIRSKLGIDLRDGLCVWTKVGQIHRNSLPFELVPPATDAGKQVVLKASVDFMWNATFVDLLDRFNWNTRGKLNGDIDPKVLEEVEKLKLLKMAKGLTRDQVRMNEFSEAVQLHLRPVITAQLREWHIKHRFPNGVGALATQLEAITKEAVSAFREGALERQLASIAIPVDLYTLYETTYQRTRALKTNDWMDWRHAAVALPYCDVFFTERHLAHQLRNELGADKKYGCEVFGNLQDALDRLHA